MIERPACELEGCAANEKCHCTALINNDFDFGLRKCPFYKTKEQNEK